MLPTSRTDACHETVAYITLLEKNCKALHNKLLYNIDTLKQQKSQRGLSELR
jgi:hypothetical protein